MLTRIISGAVGVLILAAILFFHDTMVLPIAVACIIIVMVYELLRAVKLHTNKPLLLVTELFSLGIPFECGAEDHLKVFSDVMTGTILIFIIWLFKHKELRYEKVFFALAVMILIPQSMSTIVRIEAMDSGLFLLVMGLCGAWIADTGAYFTGVAIGKHKLCPEISPKKTIEGFVGGIVTTGLVYAIAFSVHDGFTVSKALLSFVLGAVCAVVGTVGDLSASMVKRQTGIKDYGKIMPGHGGLMDRFDSVLFVLPAYYAFIRITGFV